NASGRRNPGREGMLLRMFVWSACDLASLVPEARTVDLPQRPCHSAVVNHQKSPFIAPDKASGRSNHRGAIFVLALILMDFGRLAAQTDWPEFRGPRGDGHVSAPGDTNLIGLPLYWSETNNIKWK